MIGYLFTVFRLIKSDFWISWAKFSLNLKLSISVFDNMADWSDSKVWGVGFNTFTFLLSEAHITHLTELVVPDHTVVHFASKLGAFVAFSTLDAPEAIDLEAAFNLTDISLQLKVLHAIGADASVVSETPWADFLALSLVVQIETAITGDTAKLVVALAVGNLTVVLLFDKRIKAVKADFPDLVLTSQNRIRKTGVIHQTMSMVTSVTDLLVRANIHVVFAMFNSDGAVSVFEVESLGTAFALTCRIVLVDAA
jgi:hypothetical protein